MNLYRYKRNCENIIYHIQTKLQTQIPDELRHDVYSNVLQAVQIENEMAISRAEYAEQEYKELRKQENPQNWNEIRITLAQHIGKPITAEQVLEWMFMRDMGKRTR
jgi:hypothetical protein